MTRSDAVVFTGGLDLTSPGIATKPGDALVLANYEVNTLGTYQRILGYERYDGRPAPSAFHPGYAYDNDDEQDAARIAGREARRALIEAVPGSGPVRGVAVYKDAVYAFRDNAGATALGMYRASAYGWQAVTIPALLPGGSLRFVVAAFTAGEDAAELVAVDGVNPAWVFDGTTLTTISNGMASAPIHAEVNPDTQRLFLAYPGGSLQYSQVGDPHGWDGAMGAGEIGVGDAITGLLMQPGGALAVLCRNRTYMLYGKTADDFQLQVLASHSGAIGGSAQQVTEAVYLDDAGLTTLSRSQSFGNFEQATISPKVKPLLDRYRYRITCSGLVREKNQYRLMFDDGEGVICTFRGNEASFSTFNYGRVVRCWFTGELSGREAVFFGSDNGFVYQAESGFSFDGEPYTSRLRPTFHHYGSPLQKKRFKKLTLELETTYKATMLALPDFDYSDPGAPAHGPVDFVALGGGGYYDTDRWDETRWSTAVIYTAELYISGIGRSLTFLLSTTSDREPPHRLHSAITEFIPLGLRR